MKNISIKNVSLFTERTDDGDYHIYDDKNNLLIVLSSETFNLIFQIR